MNNPYSDILDINISSSTTAQDSLKLSLIQLLGDNNINDISIKELCRHAFVARSTYYAYYNNIDEILEDIENDMIYKLVHLNTELMNKKFKKSEEMLFYWETISLIENNKIIFYTLLIANPDYRFIEKWKKGIKYHLWERIKPYRNIKNFELVLEIVASAAIGAYTFWLTHPYDVDQKGTLKILSGILKEIDYLN